MINDITLYIDFLRKSGYAVSVSCYSDIYFHYLPILYKYEEHVPEVCSYLKSNSVTHQKCIANKRALISKHPDKVYYACCYAGVEEFLIPVLYNQKPIICINVSGYRGLLKKSVHFMNRIKQQFGNEFERIYNTLSADVPTQKEINSIINPLKYMFIALYEQCLKYDFADAPADKMYRRAIEYVYNNYMNRIDSKEVADFVNCSESYLRHIFLDRCGLSVSKFINDVRLKKANELLLNTELCITEIAGRCGFCDSNYFSTVFKNFFGLSPRKYRNFRMKAVS